MQTVQKAKVKAADGRVYNGFIHADGGSKYTICKTAEVILHPYGRDQSYDVTAALYRPEIPKNIGAHIELKGVIANIFNPISVEYGKELDAHELPIVAYVKEGATWHYPLMKLSYVKIIRE